MKEIQLSNGGVTLVDDEDYEKVIGPRWHRHDERGKQYVRYAVLSWPEGKKKQTIFLMHRAILDAPTELFIDHRDGDGLNNQRYNLRLCTNQQNSMNQKIFCTNTSGHKGVSWAKNCQKWEAYIWFRRKKINLGLHKNIIDAIAAREEAEKRLFGEWARNVNNTQVASGEVSANY